VSGLPEQAESGAETGPKMETDLPMYASRVWGGPLFLVPECVASRR